MGDPGHCPAAKLEPAVLLTALAGATEHIGLIATASTSYNFGLDGTPLHRERYRRAAEFVEVSTKLWDSWADDAVVADKESGVHALAERIRAIGHQGEFFRVDGPLNVRCSPQGYPLLLQAGPSEDGKDIAARYAEAVVHRPADPGGGHRLLPRRQGAGRGGRPRPRHHQDSAWHRPRHR
ncbi:LLM class flavin-dependent oxidoreductase [Streptomyces araujoniae]|uniref:LLM class flavin-dependent oxidoreductase n=1 Tax=Streptomyces sp. ZEA17I TaxID=2202516 RepID=UPI0015E85C6A|nr:LLM class flavin-dependent oxidoreductase [Streptomyces sp. ZEA17I]